MPGRDDKILCSHLAETRTERIMPLPTSCVPLESEGRPLGLLNIAEVSTRHHIICIYQHVKPLTCLSELEIIILILEKKK